jgi:hypothetical protein
MTMLYFTTWGRTRGCCGHRHRTLESAASCLREEQRQCQAQGTRSDRSIRLLARRDDVARFDDVPPELLAAEPATAWRDHLPR